MLRRLLPRTDLAVTQIGLGAATLGVKQSEADAYDLLDRYVAAGGNLLDTARIYSDWIPGEIGRSERILGAWMKARGNRDQIILSTKGGHPPLNDMAQSRLSRQDLLSDVEQSLQTLQTDVIDLYWLHRDDPARPVDDMIETLNALRQAGRIRWFGAANWTSARIAQANRYADRHGLVGFATNQLLWNLGSQGMRPPPDPSLLIATTAERAAHQTLGVTIMPYAAQAGGYFSKLMATPDAAQNSPYDTTVNRTLLAPLRTLMRRHHCSVNAIVLSYLLSQSVVPLVGCNRVAQLDDTLLSLAVTLDQDELKMLGQS